nr:DUF5076 domain-containing protein [uncultured Undibacterium sp.]
MRELVIPIENAGDPDATEMIRVWLGNGSCNISLLLGMYEDAEDCDIDELEVWGNILSDIAQHIANGFKQSHDWDEVKTMAKLRHHFNQAIKEHAPGLEGHYLKEH